MKLVLIRHAHAEDRVLLQRDHARVLSPKGRRCMRRAAKGLHTLLPSLDVVACSPLVRTRQTAQIIANVYGKDLVITPLPALAPGKQPRIVLNWLCVQPMDATVALIGHEPDLGRLMGWLLSGQKMSFTHFKKSSVALIEFTQTPRAGSAILVWLLTATHLVKLD